MPPDTGPAWDQTTWSGAVGQCPDLSVRSSTGPLGEDRPTRCTWMLPAPLTPGMVNLAAAVVSGNGPATPVTPDTCEVAASRADGAADSDMSAATSAPCWAAKPRSNG